MLRDLWRDRTLPTRGDLRRWRQTNPEFNARLRAAVNAICRDPGMPSVVTVMLWRKERPGRVCTKTRLLDARL